MYRYLKGVFNKLKPVLKWPVDTVLGYLSLFWPLDKINLKERSLKLVILTAVQGKARCQMLTFLKISAESMQRNVQCFNFVLIEHLTQDKPGKVFGNIRLYKYSVT